VIDWMKLAGGLAGAAGGMMAPKPYVPPMPWGDDKNAFLMTGKDTLSGLKGNLDWLSQMRDGKKPLMTQQEQARLTADPRARLNALGASLMKQGMEREVGAGRGVRGGMYQAYGAQVGENLLNQQRQLESGVANSLAQLRPQMQMGAAQLASNVYGNQQNLQMNAYQMNQQGKTMAKAHGSALYRGLTGFSAGMGGGGFQGMWGQPGGGGGQPGDSAANPAYPIG
jgi:hypothetical protein